MLRALALRQLARLVVREVSSMLGQNIWLVLIVVFIILVLLGVVTVATK